MDNWKNIRYEKRGRVAWIVLDRPEKMNAFTGSMRDDLAVAVDLACDDCATNVIVLTGAGDAFCAGGDIDDFITGETQKKATERQSNGSDDSLPMHYITKRLHEVQKPVIAALNGVAAGGGAGLAASCDIRIGCENTRFGMVFSKRGIFPDWCSLYFLPRIVGYAKACELTFSGDVIGSEEALNIGLINLLVSSVELEQAATQMAEKMAANAPISIARSKTALRQSAEWTLDNYINYETRAIMETFASEDAQEGFRAFAAKETPNFQGK